MGFAKTEFEGNEGDKFEATGYSVSIAGIRRWNDEENPRPLSVLAQAGYQKLQGNGSLNIQLTILRDLPGNDEFYFTPEIGGGFLLNFGNAGSYPYLGFGFSFGIRIAENLIPHLGFTSIKVLYNDEIEDSRVMGFGLSAEF